MGVRLRDIDRDELKRLIDTDRLSLSQIAQRSEFAGIPEGTLSSIYHGGKTPKKWQLKVWDSLWDLNRRELLWLLENRVVTNERQEM